MTTEEEEFAADALRDGVCTRGLHSITSEEQTRVVRSGGKRYRTCRACLDAMADEREAVSLAVRAKHPDRPPVLDAPLPGEPPPRPVAPPPVPERDPPPQPEPVHAPDPPPPGVRRTEGKRQRPRGTPKPPAPVNLLDVAVELRRGRMPVEQIAERLNLDIDGLRAHLAKTKR